MHLTLSLRMLHCMLVCASYYYQPLFFNRNRIPPLGGSNKGLAAYIHVTPMWDFPHSKYGLCDRDFPSESCGFTAPLMGFPPLGSTCVLDFAIRIFPSQRPDSIAGICLTRGIKLTGITDGTNSTRENNKHIKPSTRQVIYLWVKQKHFEET